MIRRCASAVREGHDLVAVTAERGVRATLVAYRHRRRPWFAADGELDGMARAPLTRVGEQAGDELLQAPAIPSAGDAGIIHQAPAPARLRHAKRQRRSQRRQAFAAAQRDLARHVAQVDFLPARQRATVGDARHLVQLFDHRPQPLEMTAHGSQVVGPGWSIQLRRQAADRSGQLLGQILEETITQAHRARELHLGLHARSHFGRQARGLVCQRASHFLRAQVGGRRAT